MGLRKKRPQHAFRVFESAKLDYPSKEKKGDTSRCRRRVVKIKRKKNEVTDVVVEARPELGEKLRGLRSKKCKRF